MQTRTRFGAIPRIAITPVTIALMAVLVAANALAGGSPRGGMASVPNVLAAEESPGTARTVIVDTDLGEDDFMALAWLLREPSLDVVALTVSGTGLTHCDPGVATARALAAYMGNADLEIGCGPEQAMGGGSPFPDDWRAGADSIGGAVLPPASEPPSPIRAADVIIADRLRAEVEPVTILTLGPLTTLATVLDEDPTLTERIAAVVSMGGALDVGGNVIPEGASAVGAAEWNLHVDPVAAAEVLSSGVPITFVALDATAYAPMTAQIAASLAGDHVAPGAWLAQELIDRDPYLLSGQWYLWDPLAAGALIDRTLVTIVEDRLSVQTSGADAGRLMRDPVGPPARIAVAADTARFTDAFLAGVRRAL